MFKEESLSEKLLKKSFWLYLFTFIIAPSWYLIRVILSNSLPVSDIGLLFSIIWFISLISTYNDLWLTASLNYFLPKYRINKQYDYFKTAIFLSLSVQIFTWILISLLLFFWSDYISTHYFHTIEASRLLKVFCIYFLWINVFQVITTIFNTFQEIFYIKLTDFIRQYINLFLTFLLFLFWNLDINNYSKIFIFSLYVWIIFSVFTFFRKYNFTIKTWKIVYKKEMIKEYLSYTSLTFISANLWILLLQTDQQMIMYYLWSESAWYYTNYLSLIMIFNLIILPLISSIFFPIYTELFNKNKTDKLEILQNFFYKYIWVLALSFWFFLYILWPEIAFTLFWEKYKISWELLKISAPFLLIQILLGINSSIIVILWKLKKWMFIGFIWTLLNIILNYYLIKIIWIKGSIISTVIVNSFFMITSYIFINKYVKIKIDYLYYFKNLIFILLFSICIYFLKINILNINPNNVVIYNLSILWLVFITYYLYLWLVNYKDLIILKNEIIKLKKQ